RVGRARRRFGGLKRNYRRVHRTHPARAAQRFRGRPGASAQVFAAHGSELRRIKSYSSEASHGAYGIARARLAAAVMPAEFSQCRQDRKGGGGSRIDGWPERACGLTSNSCSTKNRKAIATDISISSSGSNRR